MTIRAFIANGNTYTFPTTSGDQEFKTNFSNLVNKATRLPGADGGHDEYGFSRAPSEIGNVQFGIVLESETTSGMQALRDAIKQMAAWGKGRLIDTINGTDRWCWARINANDITEQRHMHSDLFQPVKLTFQASDPHWYTTGTEGVLWGGSTWGGATWDGTASPTTITTTGTITVTNNGSADTLARLVLWNNSGSTITNPRVRRMIAGTAADDLLYTGTIADGVQLELNPRRHTALYDGTDVLSNLTFTHPEWMRLLPGSNSLQVDVTGVVKVYVHYYERYT